MTRNVTPALQEIKVHVGRQVMQHRVLCGLSEGELAEYMDVGQAQIGNYERGDDDIPVNKLPALSRALRCNIDDFFPPHDVSRM
jgi:transcriptional regulator with XRE-family HTH domain